MISHCAAVSLTTLTGRRWHYTWLRFRYHCIDGRGEGILHRASLSLCLHSRGGDNIPRHCIVADSTSAGWQWYATGLRCRWLHSRGGGNIWLLYVVAESAHTGRRWCCPPLRYRCLYIHGTVVISYCASFSLIRLSRGGDDIPRVSDNTAQCNFTAAPWMQHQRQRSAVEHHCYPVNANSATTQRSEITSRLVNTVLAIMECIGLCRPMSAESSYDHRNGGRPPYEWFYFIRSYSAFEIFWNH